VGRGHLVIGAFVVAWPLGAWLVVGLRRLPAHERWRPFAWAAVAATGLALAALIGAAVLFSRGGTTLAMQGLGGQIVAAASLLGALVSGAIAGVLRSRVGSDDPPHP
jgi:amino acid transporter